MRDREGSGGIRDRRGRVWSEFCRMPPAGSNAAAKLPIRCPSRHSKPLSIIDGAISRRALAAAICRTDRGARISHWIRSRSTEAIPARRDRLPDTGGGGGSGTQDARCQATRRLRFTSTGVIQLFHRHESACRRDLQPNVNLSFRFLYRDRSDYR